MSRILKYEDYIILENKEKDSDKRYDYGCAMLYFNFPKMDDIHSKIEEDDIETEGGNGLETEPHCTLLYGLHDEEIDDDKDVMDTITSIINNDIKLVLYNVSLFENDNDVLKFDVKQMVEEDEEYDEKEDVLFKCNKELTKKFPFTTDYPDYHPHCTIAYLKKGEGKKYVEMFKDKEFEITPNKIVYSKSDNTKVEEKLKKED